MTRIFRTLLAAAMLFATVPAMADSSEQIDADVRQALDELYKYSSAAKELADKAVGILVFPKVVKGGVVIGGEYGEGAMLVDGKTIDYYSIGAGSVGLQLGLQQKSQVVLFMTKKAFDDFRNQDGWKAGVDGSVALATLGAGGQVDTNTAKKPIIGFIFSNKGLMFNLTFEGAKISKIKK